MAFGGLEASTQRFLLQCPGCRRGRTSSPLLGRRANRPQPSLSSRPPGASRAGAHSGPAQTSGSPAVLRGPPQPQAEGRSPGHLQTSTTPTAGSQGARRPGRALPTPRLGQVPGLRGHSPAAAAPHDPAAAACLALTPVASSPRGPDAAASPPDPLRCRAAGPESTMKAAAAPFPPSSFSASLHRGPPRISWIPVSRERSRSEPPASGLALSAVARQAQMAPPGTAMAICEASYTHTGGGDLGKAVNEDSLN